MEFVILGPTALVVDGQPVPLGAAKQRGLLGVLLYHAGRPVRVDDVVDHLWGNRSRAACRANLHALISRNRAALKTAGLPDALVRMQSVEAYRLDVDPALIDYHRFRRLVDGARTAAEEEGHERSAALLYKAMELWRDEPLADLRGARSEHIRRAMKEGLLAAHKLLSESEIRIGRHEAVIERIEPLLLTNDVDQTLARHWITALYASGREDDARRFSIEFRNRYRRRMRAEPTIDLPPLRRRSTAVGAWAHPFSDPAGDGRASFRIPQQLPPDIADFTGQHGVLAELDATVASGGRVVVIDGMPGIGKTTLAMHWAHRQRDRFPDGQLYLNADGYGPMPPVHPEDALARFLLALGVPTDRIPARGEQRRERFNQILDGRRILIVLDNALNSDQVRPLLPTAENCVTLITSRNRLKSLTIRQGIRSVTIPPLPDDERRSLLGQVIGRVRMAHEPGPVETLAQLSDGLPLALRIMGEHITVRSRVSIAELVDELRGRLLESVDDDEEGTTLSTVFAWSYRELDPEAGRLFRLLGLYPGRNVSAPGAAALLGADARQAERLLDALAKRHLINHDTARRYRLHDLLRMYATKRAEHEEPAEARRVALRRLLDWYLLSAVNAARRLAPQRPPVPDLPPPGAVEPLRFGDDEEALRWCEAERSNLAAVVRAAADNAFHRHAWQLPGALHEVFGRYGRQDDVLAVHRIALPAAEADGHQIGQIGTLNNLGATYFALHDYHRAASGFEAALRLAERTGKVEAAAVCSHNLANVYLKAGEARKATRIFARALETCRASGSLEGQAANLHRLGDAHQQLRRYARAADCYQEALTIRERIGSLRGQGAVHGRLGALRLATGDPKCALRHSRRALEIQVRAKDDAARCDTLVTYADAERLLGRYDEATTHALEAISLSDGLADSLRRAAGLAVLADVLAAEGDLAAAYDHCLEALGILGDLTGPDVDPVLDRLLAIENLVAPRQSGQRIASIALRAATSTGSQTGAYGGA
ncbi:AfsR/SARP family transcriptional regulator [Plantactinospora endophytica]|uniref:SARP family transcriptional regulator n=1 Tax=Plantactinospora endophytica TaxID=673535 RepID=A0ABQ4DU59_9ACTN|nr:tetratricopeptide repeat protein [Plantactinospora endophytica]GIG86004.1 SARP family transcriptional regulator [Plantactinospora endophytica]